MIPSLLSKIYDFDKMRFMQDGARPHRSTRVFDVMKENFEDRILTRCTAIAPKTIDELKVAIQEVIDSIDVPTRQRIMQNFIIRLCHIIANDGRHIKHVMIEYL
ncbi:UNVERIFIED_CONTAM: hypothetical protein NCL1_07279 [Trichonephila clavipes]